MNTQEIIYIVIAIVSAIVAVIMFIRKPQEKGEVTDAVMEQKFLQLNRDIANIRDNHLHSLSVQLNLHIEAQQKNDLDVCKTLTRIETKLEDLIKK